MSQLVLGGMAKGHELLQQLLHRGIGSRTLSLPLYYKPKPKPKPSLFIIYFCLYVLGSEMHNFACKQLH